MSNYLYNVNFGLLNCQEGLETTVMMAMMNTAGTKWRTKTNSTLVLSMSSYLYNVNFGLLIGREGLETTLTMAVMNTTEKTQIDTSIVRNTLKYTHCLSFSSPTLPQ